MNRNKKIILFFLTIVMSLVLSSVLAVEITHFCPEYGFTTANVNLRKAPNSNYSSFIRTLNPNTKVKVVGTVDNYYIVQLENNEVGLLYKDYVKIDGNKTNNLTYTDYSPFYGIIKGDNTIVRGGPSTSFSVYGKLNQGDKVYVIGAIQNFLLVITDNNMVGMIREDLIEKQNETNNMVQEETQSQEIENNTNEDISIYTILEQINNIRISNGVTPLELDSLVTSTAQAKARDMLENSYFSNTSPTYGTPFEMLKNAGVIYKTAGENLAGNNNLTEAVNLFLDSEDSKQNLLSNAYNYIGIGIEKSDIYGYILVLMFIGK